MTDIRAALTDLLGDPSLPLDQAIDRHFSHDYWQRTNGDWDDRAGFAAHIAHLRTIVDAISVEVLDEIIDGTRYADRHVVTIVKRDGSRVVQEVYLFGELADDGRFTRIEESTLLLSGAEADRGLANTR
jgi:hypothetical protein